MERTRGGQVGGADQWVSQSPRIVLMFNEKTLFWQEFRHSGVKNSEENLYKILLQQELPHRYIICPRAFAPGTSISKL